MKTMLNHSFVLDSLEATAEDTFHHFEELIDEHRERCSPDDPPSRLKQLVPTVNTFHTRLPLRKAFVAYNKKYALTKRKHITISFNELRHILNLAQIMALRGGCGVGDGGATGNDGGKGVDGKEEDDSLDKSLLHWEKSPGAFNGMKEPSNNSLSDDMSNFSLGPPAEPSTATTTEITRSMNSFPSTFKGPKMITFDGDQTLYSDGANFDTNPELANYLYLLLRHGVTIAVVTAAGYEYATEKYELRLSGLLAYFKKTKLPAEDCERFYLFGGECNYLLVLGSDYKLHPLKENGAGGWMTATKYIEEAPGNWEDEKVKLLLDVAEESMKKSVSNLRIRGRVIRKKRSVGLIPISKRSIPREALDETVLGTKEKLDEHTKVKLPFCAFNGGSDVWVDVGNKRVGVHILSAYLGMPKEDILHIGDQFLNTGNDVAARDICPCIWITSPDETTYILKTMLRLAGVPLQHDDIDADCDDDEEEEEDDNGKTTTSTASFNLKTVASRNAMMDVYTGEMLSEN
jgi:IMP and pyridine-specific 5'-nucleotidase